MSKGNAGWPSKTGNPSGSGRDNNIGWSSSEEDDQAFDPWPEQQAHNRRLDEIRAAEQRRRLSDIHDQELFDKTLYFSRDTEIRILKIAQHILNTRKLDPETAKKIEIHESESLNAAERYLLSLFLKT